MLFNLQHRPCLSTTQPTLRCRMELFEMRWRHGPLKASTSRLEWRILTLTRSKAGPITNTAKVSAALVFFLSLFFLLFFVIWYFFSTDTGSSLRHLPPQKTQSITKFRGSWLYRNLQSEPLMDLGDILCKHLFGYTACWYQSFQRIVDVGFPPLYHNILLQPILRRVRCMSLRCTPYNIHCTR